MLQEFADYITYTVFGLESGTAPAGALSFFIYDTLKIFLLLSTIIFIVAVIRSYFSPERTRRILSHKKEFIGIFIGGI